MTASVWTPDRVKRLVALWGDGLSASAIAAELGNGITRNSVIGRINRFRETDKGAELGARRGSPIRTPAVEPEIVDIPQFLGVPLAETAAVESEPEVVVPPPAPVVALKTASRLAPTPARAGVGLVDLELLSCRYPLWGTAARTGLFCGEPKEPGRTAYCTAHRERCEPGRPQFARARAV